MKTDRNDWRDAPRRFATVVPTTIPAAIAQTIWGGFVDFTNASGGSVQLVADPSGCFLR